MILKHLPSFQTMQLFAQEYKEEVYKKNLVFWKNLVKDFQKSPVSVETDTVVFSFTVLVLILQN